MTSFFTQKKYSNIPELSRQRHALCFYDDLSMSAAGLKGPCEGIENGFGHVVCVE
jgi:hypothetical protein